MVPVPIGQIGCRHLQRITAALAPTHSVVFLAQTDHLIYAHFHTTTSNRLLNTCPTLIINDLLGMIAQVHYQFVVHKRIENRMRREYSLRLSNLPMKKQFQQLLFQSLRASLGTMGISVVYVREKVISSCSDIFCDVLICSGIIHAGAASSASVEEMGTFRLSLTAVSIQKLICLRISINTSFLEMDADAQPGKAGTTATNKFNDLIG